MTPKGTPRPRPTFAAELRPLLVCKVLGSSGVEVDDTLSGEDVVVVAVAAAVVLVVGVGVFHVVGIGSPIYRFLTPYNGLVMLGGNGTPFSASGWRRKTHPDSR